MQAMGETTEMQILPVAQRQHGIIEVLHCQPTAQQLTLEPPRAVRRLSLPERADDKQRLAALTEIFFGQLPQTLHTHGQA